MLRMLVVARNTNQNATLSRAMPKLPEERQSFREGGETGNKDPVGPIRPSSSLPDLLFGLNYLRATVTIGWFWKSSCSTTLEKTRALVSPSPKWFHPDSLAPYIKFCRGQVGTKPFPRVPYMGSHY
ncbi:hypothetical protein K435DRAFT_804797 [Dendrothele bispora CBS 962.96]|uniref:Uncharacterized protein n=1 Tax=Dendrothele bispora (strain CBS 962.96) TaxID=1314807 RepID=A0A4S8LDN4_DENBC|nr:hypothetical protein K435DRAFT_804797 [Dendrothele bispora CBS 962.96]